MKQCKNIFEKFKPVSLIGVGIFAEIILKTFLNNGVLEKDEITATVRRETRANELFSNYGIKVGFDNSEAAKDSRTIIICVRPQQINEIASDLSNINLENKNIISVVAGVTIQHLKNLFNSKNIIRANPNPQLEAGFGYTAISSSKEVSRQTTEWVKHLFDCLGENVFVDEQNLDIFSALSGITHVLYFFECLVDAGIYLGLNEEVSQKIVLKSIMGTMKLLEQGKGSPLDLLRKATTPGGVGAEKLFFLEKGRFKATVIEAIKAARDKSNSFREV
jgi:pyrroline-5-carboxylate reductase